jgi:hypothetical protein
LNIWHRRGPAASVGRHSGLPQGPWDLRLAGGLQPFIGPPAPAFVTTEIIGSLSEIVTQIITQAEIDY